jgi:tetratricopeptide (TPR) repeat protein
VSDRLSDQGAAAKEVELARRMIEAEDYGTAIPRLLHVASKYPGSTAAHEAHFWLGVAYYRIQSYRDAINMFQEYQELAPKGRYAKESAEYAAKLTDEYDARYMSAAELDSSIGDTATQLQANPGDRTLQLQLADLLWQRGDYARAGEIYAALVGADPNNANEPVVATRVEFLPNGTYILLTPAEIQRRQVTEEPLVIEGSSSFKSGRDLLTREPRYYVVTGRVRNRGDSVLYGVEVHLTLYGFGNVVFDTNTVNIGRMNPGEVRAFSTQFSSFPNIEDINRYEIVPSFQR